MKPYVRLLRPPSWIKNLLVYAALFFAGRWTSLYDVLDTTLVFGCFCCVASLGYIANDWRDRHQDRRHPTKSDRPLAAGTVSPWGVLALVLVLLVLTGWFILLLPAAVRLPVLVVLALYAGTLLMYNLALKELFALDLIAVAAGYVLRALAGGLAINVPVTNWFLLCIFFLSLLLVTGKRRYELKTLSGDPSDHRAVLMSYSPRLLDQFLVLMSSAALITYALYTLSSRGGQTISRYGMPASVVFVLYGLLRYFHLIYEQEQGGAPEELVFSDLPLALCVIGWVGFVGLFIIL